MIQLRFTLTKRSRTLKNIDFWTYSIALAGSIFMCDKLYFASNFEKNSNIYVHYEADSKLISKMLHVKQINQCTRSIDCKIMAEAIYFEGRGEKPRGQIAIAQVVQRRSEKMRKSIKQVVYQKNSDGICQFSYVCDIRDKRISGKKSDSKSWTNSLIYAYGVMMNRYPDYSKGADHYFNPRKLKEQPYWSKKMIQVSSIDNHVFYASGYTKAL